MFTGAEVGPKLTTLECGEKPGLDPRPAGTRQARGVPAPRVRQAVQPLVAGIWGSPFPFPQPPLSFLLQQSEPGGALRSTEHFGIHKMVIY